MHDLTPEATALRDRAIAPVLAKLSDGPSLIPARPIQGDRVYEHPSGWVSVKVREGDAIWFDSMSAFDAWLEEIDRERSPGSDPWRAATVTDLTDRR